MAELTYDELVRRIPKWLYAENNDLVAEMPAIISDAQLELEQIMDHDLFQAVLTAQVGGDDDIVDLESHTPRVLEVREVGLQHLGDNQQWPPLSRRDLGYLRALYSTHTPATPRFYSSFGSQLRLKFFPYPDQVYSLSITANVRPATLSATTQTNIITKDHSRALERACMKHGALFQKNYQDAEMFSKEMVAAVGEANAAIGRKRRDNAETRPRETMNATGT